MMIVASNSLTVSNVNDGTITHTAYAWSADGTDRFTTVYPGENLYLNSKAISDSYGVNGSKVTVEPFDSTTNMWHIVAPLGTSKTVGIYLYGYADDKLPDSSDWSYSADVKGTGKIAKFGVEAGNRNQVVGTIGSEWSRVSQTGQLDNSKRKTLIMYFDTTSSPTDVYIKLPKLGTGNVPTPWMPSASEVTTADYPSYIGQYSDFTQADSTNPSDYTWSLMRGNDGKTPHLHTAYSWSADGTDRFMTMYPEENLLLNTSNELKTVTASNWGNSPISLASGTYGAGRYYASAYIENTTPVNIKFYIGVYAGGKFIYNALGGFIPAGKSGIASSTFDISEGRSFPSAFIGFESSQTESYTYKYKEMTITRTPSPWTPSPLDDPEGAYPKFIGTYTDYIADDSTDPSKYTWAKIRGEQGERGKQIFKSSHETASNSSGNYWSDLSPAPSVDNPPKIGDTVITPAGNIFQINAVTVGGGGGGGVFGVGNILGNIKGPSGKDGVAGKDGVGIKSTQIMYAQNTSGTTAPTTGWTAQVPTLIKGQYLWTQTTWVYTDSTGEAGYTVSYNAKDGNTGANGIAGKDGVGIKLTVIDYAVSSNGVTKPSTGWSTTIPTVTPGQFLWTRTTWSYTDSTTEVGYSVAQAGATGSAGKDGIAGKDGVGVKATAITYAQSTSGTTPPTTGWTAGVPTLVKGQYLWTKTVWTYTDSSTETGYTVSYNAKDGNTGADGRAGKDGVGITNTVIEYVGAVSGTSKPVSGWSTTIPTVPAGQYLWTRTTWQYTDGTSEQGFTNALMGRTGTSGKDGVAGKDGVGIKSTIITYQLSTSGTTTPTGAWSTTVPALVKGQYLWTRTTLIYTDNTNEHVYSVSYVAKDGNNGTDGVAGKDGVGIKSTTITYQSSTSGTVQPTGAWVSNPPSVTGGSYLWTRTVWSYTDGTNETGYSIAKAGDMGQSVWSYPYDRGANRLGSYWSDLNPTPTTDNSPKVGDTIIDLVGNVYQITNVVVGTTQQGGGTFDYGSLLTNIKGDQGLQGPKGIDGKSSYTHIAYGTSSTGAGFTQTPSASTTYIGMYVDQTAIDSNDPTKYKWTLIKGANGANGAPGKPGADGRTPYFHQAWADSQDGKINFSTTDPTNRGYLGTYTDFTQADSTDPTKYFWVELVGALSIGGRNYLLDTNTPWQIQGSGGVNQSSAMKWLFTFGTIKQAPFKDGEYVTVSFDYISTGTGTYGTILSQFNEAPWGQFKGAGDAMKDNGHVVYTVQWKSDWTTSGTATGIQIRLDNVATTRTVTVYNMQFERGNKDTDWKQAPEDTQGQIDKVNNGLGHVEGLYNSILTPIASITAPTNPKTDQQWWVLDANGKTVGFKIWNGKTWADAQIQQSAMNIGTLNGNTINGATINSSEYNVAYDETKENTGRVFGPYFKGTQVIKGGSYLSDYTVKGTTQTGFNHITPDGITTGVDDANGRMVNQATLGRGYLVLSEQGKTGVITGDLNAQDSYRNSTDSVAWLGGWGDWGNGNGLIHVVRNGRLVTLSGYPHHNNTTEMGNVFQLPAWAKPATGTNISTVSYNSGVGNATACRIFINNNGLAIITGGQRGGYVVIGASYVGKDM